MAPIWYRMRGLLRARWASTLTLAVVVAAIGGLVLTLTAGVLRTVSAPERYTEQQGEAYDATLEQGSGPPRTVELAALPAVARIDMATFVFGGLQAEDGTETPEVLVFAGSQSAFGTRITQGREPDPSAPGEFVASRSWAEASGVQVGDRFQLVTITQEQADERGFDVAEPDGPVVTATLVGVIDGPTELEDPHPVSMFPTTLLDQGDVGVSASIGAVGLAPGATIDDLRSQLDDLPGGDQIGLDRAQLIAPTVRAAVSAQGQGLAVVAAIVAVAALAVLGQLLSRQARLPAAQRRALSSIGLTRVQVLADPLFATAVPVLLGAAGAAGLAYALSGLFPTGFVERIEPTPGLLLDPLVHGAGPVVIAGLLLLWVLVALLVGDREGRRDPVPGVTDRLAGRLRPGPVATGIRFAFARQPRDPGSVRAPIIGLVVVVGVLVGALTFGSSVRRFIDEPARYGNDYDLAIGVGGNAIPESVREAIERDPDVAALTLYGTTLTNVGSVSLDLTGMEPVVGDLRPEVLSGHLPDGPGEIILGRVAARQLGVDVGDDLVLPGPEAPVTFHVTGLAVIPSIEGGDGIGEGGIVTLEGLRRVEPDAQLGSATIRVRDGASVEATGKRLSETTGMTMGGAFDRPTTVVNIDRVRATPFIVAGALGTLAVLSLAHQLLMSARRRRRDLAVLRALGADHRWVGGVLHWQVTALACAVLVFAAPLGVALGRTVYQIYIDRIGARNDVSIPYLLIAAIPASLVALGNAAAIIPSRRARHEVPARVLAEE